MPDHLRHSEPPLRLRSLLGLRSASDVTGARRGTPTHVASSCLDMFYACAGNVTEASKASSEGLQPVIAVIIGTLSSWLLCWDRAMCYC